MLYALLRKPKEELTARLPRLRAITCGGDTVHPWVFDALDEKLPGVRFDQGYGLTEGGGVVVMLEDRYRRSHPASVGRPLPHAEIRVVDADGAETGPDEQGEILVRSPATSPGYWHRPEVNAATFVDGWCHTGDRGRVSADGFLYITGRIKDMIRSGGENIYPAEIEALLAEHPDVLDVAVVGVPDERFTEVGCAVLVAAPGATVTDDELRALCRNRLAHYKCPKHFVRVAELPRTVSGKVTKHVLRETYRDVGIGDETI